MATNVKFPDMGEGIEDVVINRWLVQEGDTIGEGDALVEVATDKVDTEIPAPTGGTILKLNFSAGELAPIDAVIAVIGEAGESIGEADDSVEAEAETAETADMPEPETGAPIEAEMQQAAQATTEESEREDEAVKATPVARRIAADQGVSLASVSGSGPGGQIRKNDVLSYMEQRQDGQKTPAPSQGLLGDLADVAPLSVRRVAADYNVDLRDVANGRPLSSLTRYDVLRYVAERDNLDYLPTEPDYPSQAEVAPAQTEEPAQEVRPGEAPRPQTEAPKPQPAVQPAVQAKPAAAPEGARELKEGEMLVPHTRMRQIIARNMVQSAFTSPHVTTVHDVDMSAVTAHYQAHKGEFAKEGVRLTLTAYIIEAIVAGLKAVPAANSTWTEEGLIIKRYYNVGMAVALPQDENGLGGLIVPVIKNVGDLNLRGIARQVDELARKARDNQLAPTDLQDGTFTLTNYGTSGSKFQTPVIFPPQAAILGTGAIVKQPVVVSNAKPYEASLQDYLAFRPMMEIALSYDHRVLDGATADAFCVAVKEALENWR